MFALFTADLKYREAIAAGEPEIRPATKHSSPEFFSRTRNDVCFLHWHQIRMQIMKTSQLVLSI
jgi:hypothetical protein